MTAKSFYEACLSLPGLTQADAFELLKYCFAISKENLWLYPQRQLPDKKSREIITRLSKGEPSAYVAGRMEFADVTVLVAPLVLIPRPETEELTIKLMEEFDLNGKAVLDLCTGSGCIALALAKRFPKATVVGKDISDEALALAFKSGVLNGLANVSFSKQDFLNGETGRYDLLVCNPPYIPQGEKTETKDEPEQALFSGKDGLDSYKAIFPKMRSTMKLHGVAAFEIDPKNAMKIEGLAKAFRLPQPVFVLDLEGKKRFVKFYF